MKGEDSSHRPGAPVDHLTAWLTKRLFHQAAVSEVEALSERFRLIALSGAGLKDIEWSPGQKI